jgi:hypothetical protein
MSGFMDELKSEAGNLESGNFSNFFSEAKTDLQNLEKKLLGPDYNYVSFINTPDEIGMGPDGNLSQLVDNVGGLVNYVELLATGTGKASTIGGPLGDSFFLPTGAKCTDVDTGNLVTRSIWVNNIPDGKIPFITSALNGKKFTDFEGLVPGVLGNLASIHPMQIFQAFTSGAYPSCQLVSKTTRDENNVEAPGSGYLTMEDIQIMGTDGFTTLNKKKNKKDKSVMPDDEIVKLYYGALGLLGLYIFIKLFIKKQK